MVNTKGSDQPTSTRPQQERPVGSGQSGPIEALDLGAPRTPTTNELLVPHLDVEVPEVSIVVPAVDESLTISLFVSWCLEGLRSAGVNGEVLIVDSSSDNTPDLALSAGARVLRTPRQGLGRAYIEAIPYIRGQFVVMGDADCTYDFRELAPFVEQYKQGYEFVMGSRWLGSIEKGSMPALHRYLGTPATTWVLNRVYGTQFTDIHCGMRGITREALIRMGLESQSWEYASEMVLKSARLGLRTVEVPVMFYKDREGRLSHHKREGWRSPFKAAWNNLKTMFIYKAEFFALRPGLALLVVGIALTLPLSAGAIRIGGVTFNLYTMLLGMLLALVGLHSFFFGCLAQMFSDSSGRARHRWVQMFRYTRAAVTSFVSFLVGLGLSVALFVDYVSRNFTLPPATDVIDHLGLLGLFLMTMGFSTFCFTLTVHSTAIRYGPSASPADGQR